MLVFQVFLCFSLPTPPEIHARNSFRTTTMMIRCSLSNSQLFREERLESDQLVMSFVKLALQYKAVGLTQQDEEGLVVSELLLGVIVFEK
jgi:hypothetical protein